MTTRTWAIDAAHTDVAFSAKHMMITTVRGSFAEVEGELRLDEADPTASGGVVGVRVRSLSTGSDARDEHLRSPDFFDADAHEWIVFRATAIRPSGARSRYEVAGDLEIRGVSRPIVLDVEHHGVVPGMQGERRAAMTVTGTLRRSEWGLTWNVALDTGGWLVSDEIKLTIEVAAVEAAADGAADAPASEAARAA